MNNETLLSLLEDLTGNFDCLGCTRRILPQATLKCVWSSDRYVTSLLTVAHTCLCSRLRINVLSKILQNISLHLVNNFLSSLSRITQTFLPALHYIYYYHYFSILYIHNCTQSLPKSTNFNLDSELYGS